MSAPDAAPQFAGSAAQARAVTYRNERLRALASGMLESMGTTFLLLIANRYYHVSGTEKAMLAAGQSLGLLVSPVTVSLVRRLGWLPSVAAGRFHAAAAVLLLLPAVIPGARLFTLAYPLGVMLAASTIPLFTQMYQDNYPEHERGRLFTGTAVIRIAMAALFSWGAGWFLDGDIGRVPILLGVFAAAMAFSARCLAGCPSRPLHGRRESGHPLHALRYVGSDRVFRWTLVSWMLLGFGNLVMLPLRVEYLANPRYGITLDPAQVALYTGVIPNVARLVMSRVWGHLFDRVNFFLLRIILNVGFILGILAFFTGSGVGGLVTGGIFFGVAWAGGDVAWSLWVTKLAPPEKVAEYMSVHTFFTGIRGIVAPFVAFAAITRFGVGQLGVACTALIAVASLMLLTEVRSFRPRRPGQPLVPGDGN